MKVLVCGSRDWAYGWAIEQRVKELPHDAIVIHGCAEGADTWAGIAARVRGMFEVRVPCHRALWRKYGRSAGHKRNAAMLDLGPDLVIAFQRNESKGTQGTIDHARELGIPVEVYTWDERAQDPRLVAVSAESNQSRNRRTDG